MAVNMMEILKEIQRELGDQKIYIKNLDHVVNIHLTIMETIHGLHKKIDQQQNTIEKLEQQVRKNNTLLFGKEESDFEKKIGETEKQNIEDNKEKDHLGNKYEKTKTKDACELQESPQATSLQRTKHKNDLDSKPKDHFQEASNKENIEKSTDNERKTEKDENDIKEIAKSSIEESTSRFHKLETIQICPAYFSADQIRKVNCELKRITEIYQRTNIFPNIEVIADTNPVDDHPVMKRLRAGVAYRGFVSGPYQYGIKLGTSGFERSQVRDLLAENPDLSLYDVVREGLKSTNEWGELLKMFNFFVAYDRYPN